MKLRIAGYTLVLTGLIWALTIIWPSLYGRYPFMPPQEYRIPNDTGETVSRKALFMHGQDVLMICQAKQAQVINPVLLMFFGAIALDVAGRKQRRMIPLEFRKPWAGSDGL